MTYKILYVEDEKILGQLVTESLRKGNYEVMQVSNGAHALSAYREFKPHVCLLDIMLPGKDGYEVAEQIRAMDKKIPILFLTAKIQTSDLVAGFSAGCNDYIRKPFSMDEVLLRIKSWISEKYGIEEIVQEAEYNINGYKFNPQKQTLETADGYIQLTHKESVVLSMLYSHRNNIVSRESILQKVWGNESIYNSRTLDVYINKLRKYLGGNQNRIITLKGIGYRFICED
jgi:DNA-binding response OmpR family regulator